ncbi:prepilin peptidase [Blastomonas sp. UPD001]|jgi:prepilin peptidase CpaA|uniref:A24 family peptidase n=1 Tax=Blastomonas sp. UPD001 TaxID=2217673 RepID=UPI000E341C4A|nr:prepilin peptidase [Blastomonas sp. UPD001]
MENGPLVYGLLAALAIALLHAAYTDIVRREIEDWLNAGIALTAPVFWWACGLSFWPDMALQLALGAGVFVFFALMFAIGAMGGGDVKLLGAIALWFPWAEMARITIIMSLIGAVLTVMVVAVHKVRRSPGRPEVPYGVAIAMAALWPVGERFFNHFA